MEQIAQKIKEIRVFNIDWCVEANDIIDYHEWNILEDNICDGEIQSEIDRVLSELPTEEYIPVESSSISVIGEKIDDIADWLSDNHGWLVNSYDYELIDADGNTRRLELV